MIRWYIIIPVALTIWGLSISYTSNHPNFVCYERETIHCSTITKYKGQDIDQWSEGYNKDADKCTCIIPFNSEPIIRTYK